MTCLEMFLWIYNLKCHKNYKLSRLKTAKFVGCVSLCACRHATGTTLSKVVCLFPELPARESSEMSKWLLEEDKKKKKMKEVTEWSTKHMCYFFWQAIIWIKVQEEGYTFSNWKHAPVRQITSHKPKIIRWDKEGNGSARRLEMNISGDGGFHLVWQGLQVNFHQQYHLCMELWLKREGGEEEQQTRKIKAQ